MLEELNSKIKSLISLYEVEKQRADILQKKLDETSAKLETSSKQITELTRQIENLRLAGAFSASSSSPAAIQKVEALISEIDKCIALIEN